MELRGDEKRTQALFSELLLEDQNITPRFEQLWNSAQSTKAVPSFSRLAVAFASLSIIAVFALLAVWSNYRSVESVQSVAKTDETIAAPSTQGGLKQADAVATGPKKSKPIKRHRKIERSIAQEAALLSSWQSPTEIFMTAPTALVLNSLPQLNQSANDLRQFLPKNNEVTKESNQ
jgi:hypothetical protein